VVLVSDIDQEGIAVAKQVESLWSQPYIIREFEEIGNSGAATILQALRDHRIPVGKSDRDFIELTLLDWANPPIKDRSQLWLLQQWYFIRGCILEYRTSGTFDSVREVLPVIRSWMEVNLEPYALTNRDNLNWHDHVTALRCTHLLCYLMLLHKMGADVQTEIPRLNECVTVHLKLLTSREFYSRRTNHGFDQAVALYLMSNALNLGDLSREGARTGRERLLDEATFAFNAEGVHVENSPSYHPSMMARLLQAQNLLNAYEANPIDFDFVGTLTKAMDFLTYALRPDGLLPLFGDSQERRVHFEFNKTISGTIADNLQYSLDCGVSGEKPRFNTRVFPQAGYAFLRSQWGDKTNFSEIIHLSFKCGFLSTYHRHDDDNNVLLYAFGEDWLIDGGIYKYQEDDPLRIYMRSTLAHNVISVENVRAARAVPPKNHRSGFSSWSTVDGISQVVGKSYTILGFRYERTLRLDRGSKAIEIEDEMIRCEKGGANTFQQRFHCPMDKEITIVSNMTIDVRGRTSGRTMRIDVVDGTFDAVEVVSKQKTPTYAGWHSSEIGALSPAQTIIFHVRKRAQVKSKFKLSFSPA
jgi:hypothetical protein